MPSPSSPPPSDELVAAAGRLRFSVARLARLLRQQDVGELGATAGAALATIRREGSPTLGELAAGEHVAPPTMTKVVGKLEERGLVERQPDPDDRRVVRVRLTEAGQRHLDDNRQRRTTWLVEQLASLPPDDLAQVLGAIDVLERLAHAGRVGAPR